MELTLTALIKAIILHWGRGSSSGDKQPETKQKSSKFKMHQPPSLFPSDLNNYRPISVISFIAGHGLGILWPLGGAFVMLIVYWPMTIKFRIRKQTSKPQTNYRCCLRFSHLSPYWLISRNTITFHKDFWCSRFCEFHIKAN